MMPRISPDRTDQLTSRSATSAPYCTVNFSTRRTSSSPKRCGCSDVSTRPIQILFLSESCRARSVGRQVPIGKRDLVWARKSRETEFHAKQLKPGLVRATRIAANGGIRYSGRHWALEYRIRQLLPNFEFVHRRTDERWQAVFSGTTASGAKR